MTASLSCHFSLLLTALISPEEAHSASCYALIAAVSTLDSVTSLRSLQGKLPRLLVRLQFADTRQATHKQTVNKWRTATYDCPRRCLTFKLQKLPCFQKKPAFTVYIRVQTRLGTRNWDVNFKEVS